MGFNRVNPPRQLVLPRKLQSDIELKKAFDDRDYVLFQLWKRTGSGDDYINNAQIDISVINDKIDAILEDLATRPTQADIDYLNARIDQLIELLTVELKEANIIATQNGALSLEQFKLLNARFEEAFNTLIEEKDIE